MSGRPEPLRGLVLAGGRSERLGCDKAALQIAGRSLLERAVTLLSRVVADVQVAVREEQLSDELRRRFVLLPDAYRDIGPAAGLLAAHHFDPASAWLALACDMPGVSEPLLAALIAARDPRRGATAYRGSSGSPEPLCAIYEPATLSRLRNEVDAGGSSGLRAALSAAHPVLLDPPDPGELGSINTPEDMRRLIRS